MVPRTMTTPHLQPGLQVLPAHTEFTVDEEHSATRAVTPVSIADTRLPFRSSEILGGQLELVRQKPGLHYL